MDILHKAHPMSPININSTDNTSKSLAHIVVLPALVLYAPFFISRDGYLDYTFVRSHENCAINYPVILKSDGTPWEIANIYLTLKATQYSINQPSIKIIRGIADDLLNFLRFLEDRKIHYLHFPENEKLRVTYRFRKHIQELVLSGDIKYSTAKQRLNRIVNFYKECLKNGLIRASDIPHAPFTAVQQSIRVLDGRGFKRSIKIESHNLQLQGFKESSSPEFIQDGGNLRPLPLEDQKILLHALLETDNRAIQLIFYVALFTGARIQTCCTLQQKQLNEPLDTKKMLRLRVGAGTNIDTKNQKNMTLLIPEWLVTDLNIYAKSPISQHRQNKRGKHVSEGYVFLTNRGTPYYTSQKDIINFSNNIPSTENQPSEIFRVQEGTTIRVFLEGLIKRIRKNHPNFYPYKFHDLRATFGMNLLEALLQIEGITPNSALTILQQRMGHSDIATTIRYINYRAHYKLYIDTQNSYEEEILQYVQRH